MRNLTDFRIEQREAVAHIIDNPMSMLWLDMGLGKTVATLTAIAQLQDLGMCRAALVFAPLRVAETVWHREVMEWSHLRGTRVSKVLGDPIQRMNALMTPAHIYVINYENMGWIVKVLENLFLKKGKYPPFDFVVFDEVDKMKDSANVRSRTWRRLAPYIPRRVGLTGTPSNEGLMDLHGQFRAIDDGARLGTGKMDFQHAYFYTERFDLIPFDNSGAIILDKVKDITYSRQRNAADRKLILNDIIVPLSSAQQQQYADFKRNFILRDAGVEITAANAAVLAGKLKQWCGGAVYDNGEDGNWVRIHDEKLNAMDSIVSEVSSPLLVAFNYRHELERLKERYPYLKTVHDYKNAEQLENDWNTNKIRMLAAHPASLGHGMNLQKGKGHHMVWFSMPDSSRLYEQYNARLDRSGQASDYVMCHRLITPTHIERGVADALSTKENYQTAMRNAIEREREEIKK